MRKKVVLTFETIGVLQHVGEPNVKALFYYEGAIGFFLVAPQNHRTTNEDQKTFTWSIPVEMQSTADLLLSIVRQVPSRFGLPQVQDRSTTCPAVEAQALAIRKGLSWAEKGLCHATLQMGIRSIWTAPR